MRPKHGAKHDGHCCLGGETTILRLEAKSMAKAPAPLEACLAAFAGAGRKMSSRTIVMVGAFLLAFAGALLAGCDRGETRWVQVQPTGEVPAARAGHCMVFDARTDKVILFGGTTALFRSGRLNDTWAYDPVTMTWTALHPEGPVPAPRAFAAVAYDSTRGQMVIFGGSSNTAGGEPFNLNDIWAYDPVANTWTELRPGGESGLGNQLPEALWGSAMAYDPVADEMVLYGGERGLEYWEDEPSNLAWLYSPAANTWDRLMPESLRPTQERAISSMAYEPYSRRVILFGGDGLGWSDWRPLDEMWAYDSAAGVWSHLVADGSWPAARLGCSLTYDSEAARLVLAGGENFDGLLADVWTYDPVSGTWDSTGRSGRLPSARFMHAMVYDSTRDRLILFGGMDDDGVTNDTWVLRLECAPGTRAVDGAQ
jgi:hypothetical protein